MLRGLRRDHTFWEVSRGRSYLQGWRQIVRDLQDGTIDTEEWNRAALQIQKMRGRRRGVSAKDLSSNAQGGIPTRRRSSASGRNLTMQRSSVSERNLTRQRSGVSALTAGGLGSRRCRVALPEPESEASSTTGPSTTASRALSVTRSPSVVPVDEKGQPLGPVDKQPIMPDALQSLYMVGFALCTDKRWKIWRRDQQPRRSIRRCWRSLWSSRRWWVYYPWVVSISGLIITWLFTFIYMMKYFAQDNQLMQMFLRTVFTSIGLAMFVTLPMIIIVRNNVKATKKIMKTKRFQVIEKFVLVPLGRAVGQVYKTLLS